MKRIFVLGVVLSLFVVTASAQGPRDRVNRHRIEKGFDRGQLTRHEKFQLNKNEFKYKAEKRKALRDGKLTRAEKKRLAAIKHKNDRKIFRKKHNSRRRF